MTAVDELADGMGGSVHAVTGVAIGPYRKSRTNTLTTLNGDSQTDPERGQEDP